MAAATIASIVWSAFVDPDTALKSEKVFTTAQTHPPYASEYRQQMVETVHTGRSAGDPAREFGCSAQPIRNRACQAGHERVRLQTCWPPLMWISVPLT